MDVRMNMLLAFGKGKAGAIAAMIEGPVTAMTPASILQHHSNVKVFIDETAASELTMSDYYKWVYAGKPAWQQDA